MFKNLLIKKSDPLKRFWDCLGQTSHLFISAKTELERSGRTGEAEVKVERPHPNVFVFHESGYWIADRSRFTNIFRWTLDLSNRLIALEHLRYGENHSVFLLQLKPVSHGVFESVRPHVCKNDIYVGTIVWTQEQIDFSWNITGPKKSDELIYLYTRKRNIQEKGSVCSRFVP